MKVLSLGTIGTTRLHIFDDFLWCHILKKKESTTQTLHASTDELLNVRHAGAGLMKGRASGPVEALPCGLW